MDTFLQYSYDLLKPLIHGLRRGDPLVAEPLYHLVDYIDPQARRSIFVSLQKRLQVSEDRAIADRLCAGGTSLLAEEFPLLAAAINEFAEQQVEKAALELEELGITDPSALSSNGRRIRQVIIKVSLGAYLRAKAKRWLTEVSAIGTDAVDWLKACSHEAGTPSE